MMCTRQQHDLNEESAILCVPTAFIAEQVIMTIQEQSSVNFEFDKLENLLVFASESELPINIRKFSLEKILDQYCNAFLFWRPFVNQTINILSKYNQHHKYHLKINPKLHFLDCLKAKYSAALEDVTDCLQFFLRLPHDSFSSIDVEAISYLIVQLKDLHECLMSEEIDEGVLMSVLNVEGAPKEGSASHNHGFQLAQKLNKKRVQCIAALEHLKSSIRLKAFATRAEAAEFLVMKCKLMIHTSLTCTTLKKILSVSQKKFDLLVVSDAACMLGTTISQLQKHEIDMNTHGHVLFKALSTTFRIDYFVRNESLADNNDVAQPKNESFWIGIPKDLLSPVWDQGPSATCAFQSSAATTETHYGVEACSDNPTRKFHIRLCLLDMNDQYEIITGHKLGSDNLKDKRTRLEKSFIVLKKRGVQGYSRSNSDMKVPVAFRIKSFKKYRTNDLSTVCNLLRNNKVVAGHFRLSRNFFTLSSGQAYKYDPQQPILNSEATQACSHAVMIVGFLPSELSNEMTPERIDKEKEKDTILAYQNSYGELFGESNGFGRMEASSVRNFFLPIL